MGKRASQACQRDPGIETKRTISDNWKAKISATKLLDRLADHSLGKLRKMTPTQVRAAEVVLARLVPTLSAVEQTIHTDSDLESDQSLTDKIAALLEQRPQLLDQLIALRQAKNAIASAQEIGSDVERADGAKLHNM